MKIFTDADLEAYAQERISQAVKAIDAAHNRLTANAKEEHEWRVRRLEAQKDDAILESGRYRVGYKNALRKLKAERKRSAELSRQLNNAGMLPDPELDKMKDGSPRKLNSVQSIVDQVTTEIPGLDESGQAAVRGYVERECRMRGIDQAEIIAAEVIAGGFLEDDE